MPNRLDEDTYLAEIETMSPEELQRHKEQLRENIARSRIGPGRATENIIQSLLSGIAGAAMGGALGYVSESRRTVVPSKKRHTFGSTVLGGAVAGILFTALSYLGLRRRDRLEADRTNNHLLTHIERVERDGGTTPHDVYTGQYQAHNTRYDDYAYQHARLPYTYTDTPRQLHIDARDINREQQHTRDLRPQQDRHPESQQPYSHHDGYPYPYNEQGYTRHRGSSGHTASRPEHYYYRQPSSLPPYQSHQQNDGKHSHREDRQDSRQQQALRVDNIPYVTF